MAADKAAFYGCVITSYQDTLLDDNGNHYFKNCYIEGATDFICGSASSLYEVNTNSFYIISSIKSNNLNIIMITFHFILIFKRLRIRLIRVVVNSIIFGMHALRGKN